MVASCIYECLKQMWDRTKSVAVSDSKGERRRVQMHVLYRLEREVTTSEVGGDRLGSRR